MKRAALAFLTLFFAVASSLAFAHSGGTDKKGCHRDHTNGDYHCH